MLRRSTSLLGLMLTLFIVSMALWLAWSGNLSRAVVASELSVAELPSLSWSPIRPHRGSYGLR